MCASVLNRCQDYTFTTTNSKKSYKYNNDVIHGYLERVLVQIKSAQDEILADYAESCISDVASCLSQNTYSYSWGGNTSTGDTTTNNNPSDVAIRACMSVINSCKSVTQRSTDTSTVKDWLDEALGTSYSK